MRIITACMLLCGAVVGYSNEDTTPAEVTINDEGDTSAVETSESFSSQADWDCGCSKNKDNKPK